MKKRIFPSLLSAIPCIVLASFFLAGALIASPSPSPSPALQSADLPFRNTSLSAEQRVADLISRLTLPEKISQTMMDSPEIPRLGIPAYHWWNEALHGMARNGIATVFPQAIALAAAWDPSMHHRIAEAISDEIRARNNRTVAASGGKSAIYQGLTIWSPNINIFRDPRWGRGQETYGEDPFLTGRLAVAFVQGLQGTNPACLKTVATVKHFAVHSGPEEARHRFDAVVSERDLHETYLPAFEAGIREGNAWSLMSAYNAVDGIPAPANKRLLTDILRKDWGFRGAVVGDVDTVADITANHHYTKDAAAASALAIKAGNDLCSGKTYKALPEALKLGLLKESDIDAALGRLLLLRFKLGLFDPQSSNPYSGISMTPEMERRNDELALEAARKSLVLLKNDGTLPWDRSKIKKLAVIGPVAQDPGTVLGNYCGVPSKPVNILQGLRNKLQPLGVEILWEPAIPLVTGFREKTGPIPDGILFTDATLSAKGLKGEVFGDSSFQGQPSATRTDRQLDLFWNHYEPVEGIALDGSHLRWSGVILPSSTGDHVISLTYEGSAELILNGVKFTGTPKGKGTGMIEAPVKLEAGRPCSLTVTYNPKAGSSSGKVALGWKPPGGMDKAMEAAKKADHILLTLGITPSLEGEEMKVAAEGFDHGDRVSIALPKVQAELLERVSALGKPVVVVLTGGSSLSLDTSKASAIIQAWYYGQRGGDAIAETLIGANNPSGRLPVTFYSSETDLPPFTDYSMKGRTYRYFGGTPLYPFGHGLSYTTFSQGAASLDPQEIKSGGKTTITIPVTNTGNMTGDEVVQVYARATNPTVAMPSKWLVGFQRVTLQPGESRKVSIEVPADRLRRWDEKAGHYIVDPGGYELMPASSSANLGKPLKLSVK